jgi:hypothetical protein
MRISIETAARTPNKATEGSRGIGFRTWAQLGNIERVFQLFEFGVCVLLSRRRPEAETESEG